MTGRARRRSRWRAATSGSRIRRVRLSSAATRATEGSGSAGSRRSGARSWRSAGRGCATCAACARHMWNGCGRGGAPASRRRRHGCGPRRTVAGAPSRRISVVRVDRNVDSAARDQARREGHPGGSQPSRSSHMPPLRCHRSNRCASANASRPSPAPRARRRKRGGRRADHAGAAFRHRRAPRVSTCVPSRPPPCGRAPRASPERARAP